MKCLRILLFVFAILACGIQAFAATWDYVNESRDYKYYIDVSSIKSESGILSVWMKGVLKKKAKLDTVSGQTVYESKFKYQAMESLDKARVVYTIYYNNRGDVIRSSNEQYSEFTEVVPETIGEYWCLKLGVWHVIQLEPPEVQQQGAPAASAAPEQLISEDMQLKTLEPAANDKDLK